MLHSQPGKEPSLDQTVVMAGFREAGRLRGTFALNGRRYDEILMEITREEFRPSNLIGMLQQIQE